MRIRVGSTLYGDGMAKLDDIHRHKALKDCIHELEIKIEKIQDIKSRRKRLRAVLEMRREARRLLDVCEKRKDIPPQKASGSIIDLLKRILFFWS